MNQVQDPDNPNLRLVSDNDPGNDADAKAQFVSFMFLRVNPEWRKLNPETKKIFKSEFMKVFSDFSADLISVSYSLVGFDSKADLMFWRIGTSLDDIQNMTASMYRTNLGSFLETTDNYLSVTRNKRFVADSSNGDSETVVAGSRKYHFLYPCTKHSDWYEKPTRKGNCLLMRT